jgi:hypothetical protein
LDNIRRTNNEFIQKIFGQYFTSGPIRTGIGLFIDPEMLKYMKVRVVAKNKVTGRHLKVCFPVALKEKFHVA